MTPLLAKIFVKDYRNVRSQTVRKRYGTLSGIVGIISNMLLFGAKLAIAVLSGGVSVLADALNNLSDAGSSVVTLVGVRMAGKEPDREHPFGHGRTEYIAGFIVAVLILVVGVQLIISSVQKLIEPVTPNFSLVTIIVLACSIAVKLWMALFNRVLGKKINSPIMRATMKDSLSDCCATTAVLIGVVVSTYAGVNVDAYLGIAVALFILVTGFFAAKDCLSPLIGEKPSKELIEEIKTEVLSHEEVRGLHDLVIHDYGPGRKMVSLHVEVPADVDLVKTHDTIDMIERALATQYDCETTIHLDPIDLDDTFTLEMTDKFSAAAASLDAAVTIHDVRTVRGITHTNIVFDCVVPFKFKYKDAEVRAYFEEAATAIDPNYYVVVRVERSLAAE